LLGYYRKFIRDFARITKPLTAQLKGKKTVKIYQNFVDTFEILFIYLTKLNIVYNTKPN